MSRAYVFIVWAAGVILAGMIIAALLGATITPYDASAQNLLSRLLPPGATGPDGRHWFGTDALGRDILSLIIMGARPALFVSVAAAAVAALVGVLAGMVAGFRGGRFGDLLLSLTNIQLALAVGCPSPV
jgi:peptide/nickel transport system permease protein